MKRVVRLIAVVASLAIATSAQAQSRSSAPVRQGFWFSGGLGVGSLGCDNCNTRENSLTGDISLGGTLSQHWLLGVGTSGWSKSQNGGRLTVGTLDARVRFYPSATGGFFLTGGIGAAEERVSVGNGSISEKGYGALVGLGYDYRIARNTSITPYWNGFGFKSNNADANVGQIGLAITLH